MLRLPNRSNEKEEDHRHGKLLLRPLHDAGKQIRLLKWSTRDTSSFSLDVSIWGMDALPDYHAVSYTWGPPPDMATIHVDGRPLLVRENCHFTLNQVASHFRNDYIWIDSICIDQTSIEEKNQQVQMMGRIYASAKDVLACVGPHANGSELLRGRHLQLEQQDFDNATKKAVGRVLRAFWKRDYWRRLWIVQELELAKQIKILCGPDILGFRDFSLLPWRDNWEEHLVCIEGFVYRIARGWRARSPLWKTISKYINALCADPRDHVYALLSITSPDDTYPPIKVDYAITLPDLMMEVMNRRGEQMDLPYTLEFQALLSTLGLTTGAGLDAVRAIRDCFNDEAKDDTVFDKQLIAAHRNQFPVEIGVPNVMEHLPTGCKAATLVTGANGELNVTPFKRSDLYKAWLRPRHVREGCLPQSQAAVQKITFDMHADEVVCTVTARIASIARPGDVLLRTGLHVFTRPDMILDIGNVGSNILTEAQRTRSVSGHHQRIGNELRSEDLASVLAEQLVVIRCVGRGLFRAVGRAHITSCIPHPDMSYKPRSRLCFDFERMEYEIFYSLMSQAATFMLWTHCNVLSQTPDDKKLSALDDIVSAFPPSSYFYAPSWDYDGTPVEKRGWPHEAWYNERTLKEQLPCAKPPYLWLLRTAYEWTVVKKGPQRLEES